MTLLILKNEKEKKNTAQVKRTLPLLSGLLWEFPAENTTPESVWVFQLSRP